MKAKFFTKTVVSLLAAIMVVWSFPPAAFAAPPTGVVLGENAYTEGYTISKSVIEKNDKFDLQVTACIPISNYQVGTQINFNAYGVSDANFNIKNATAIEDTKSHLNDSHTLYYAVMNFSDVTYLGGNNVFNYHLCYESDGKNYDVPLSITLPECSDETGSKPPEESAGAKFALSTSGVYTIKAGKSENISVGLKQINNGSFANVAAALSSSDGNVLVETTETKNSISSTPQFTFKVSVPATTPAGVYNLTLTVNVFGSKGEELSGGTFTVPVKVESDISSAGLTIYSYNANKKEINPGDNFELKLILRNDCKIDLKDVKVKLEGLDSTKFVLDGGFSIQTTNIKNGTLAEVTFPLVACDGITSVRESIPVQVEYKINGASEAMQTLSTSVIVQCKPKAKTPDEEDFGQYDITMTEYSVSSNAVQKGTKFTLDLTVKNNSAKDIKSARVSLLELNGTKFAINNGLTYRDFDIKAGESKKFSFSLIGCDGISSIREVITVELSFGKLTSSAYATVSCIPSQREGGDGSDDTVFAPSIIIQNYDFGGEYVIGGSTFPLKLTIQNADSSTIIENLKVTISGGAGSGDSGVAFSPANSSNSFFIETLPGKATTDINIDLLARADSKPDSYPVNVNFQYEYIAGGKRAKGDSVTEIITIPLQQEDRFTINPAEYPESVGLGEMVYISTSFVNKGKSAVYNVTADIEGEGFDKSQGTYYVGNVNSGSEEYYDVQLTPNTEGTITGDIVVTYEDSNGTQKEQRLPFSFEVISYMMEDPMIDFGGEMMEPIPEDEGGSNIWIWIAVGGAVLVAAAIVTVVIVKRRKKKNEFEDDD